MVEPLFWQVLGLRSFLKDKVPFAYADDEDQAKVCAIP
jgi:hypothetical protein